MSMMLISSVDSAEQIRLLGLVRGGTIVATKT
jgi:hypothetical protein